MIKQVEDIYNEYEKYTCITNNSFKYTYNNAVLDISYIDYLREMYLMEDYVIVDDNWLYCCDYRINQYIDTQNRIFDGYKKCIILLIDNLTYDNYIELEKLRNFLTYKLHKNFIEIERIKKDIAINQRFPKTIKYEHKKYKLEEDSLFVEIFFVEKMKEIANVDLLKL